ncbi:GNAT family N-acetyltransferase [Paenibacillus sp.]|uniref:GNAT family N-acetyltransferase n=1 Tax=Paenibacillus sp. TaxID=58172 RepID=UPI0028124C51|nr:GNAT family N-acetyltransferase [Paenibacillus sp.]
MNGLITDRLRIREYTVEDLPALHDILSEPLTMSFWPKPFRYDQTEEWIVKRGIEHYERGFGRFAIEWKETGTLIGDAGLLSMEIDGIIENDLGYIVHSGYWGQGIGYEAASAVLKYGIEDLQLQRICSNMPVDHEASRKVAEKLGMTLEKRFSNRRNRDLLTCLYAWDKKRKAR